MSPRPRLLLSWHLYVALLAALAGGVLGTVAQAAPSATRPAAARALH